MAKYHIPEQYLPGFKVLVELTEQQQGALLSVANSIEVGSGPNTFTKEISANVPIERVQELASTMFSLGSFFFAEKEPELLSRELTESYFSEQSEEPTEEAVKAVESKLLWFFTNFSNLKKTYKAFDLLLENEKVYRNARILTDVRLVFDDDLKASERNAVIIHKLRVSFTKNKELEELYLYLDSNDLKDLKEQIIRAEEKDTIIKNDYKKAITLINLTE